MTERHTATWETDMPEYLSNLNILDQCAKPEDFSEDFMEAAWDTRWNCPQMVADPGVYLYGC